MKKVFLFLIPSLLALASCKLSNNSSPSTLGPDTTLNRLFANYHEEELHLYPINATYEGDNRFNDQLPVDFTDAYQDSIKRFVSKYSQALNAYDTNMLNPQDKLSYQIFKYNLDILAEELTFPENLAPFNQFYGLPITLGQFGSGSVQPFNTVKDYDNWIKRATAFSAWSDSAIVYFKKGIDAHWVLPKALVLKMITQTQNLIAVDPTQSVFYSPVKKIPDSFPSADKQRLPKEFVNLITTQLTPSYKKLADFLTNEYLPHARLSSGLDSIPNGAAYYAFLVKQQTTTTKTPDEIYTLGLSEVKRIRHLMDSVKDAVGFKGDLKSFFMYMNTDKKFTPYKTPAEVLAAFENIHQRMQPKLATEFNHVPKTKFEIRQTEAFRAASASAEYNQGSADGSRPGIFYVPILDATKFNVTSGMESLFLHEAIPGHHYQISLQQEDTTLPKFRRFGGQNAYVEGWALYCESLGKELGLFTDPYQYMGALGDEIHRAIRLVVDVAIHTKGMTREEAIKYMTDNEQISEQGATAEIERYMAIPAQALGYKIGALKIRELRTKYEQLLGSKFSISDFHDQILKDGSMPLNLLEAKLDKWYTKN